MKKLFPLFLLFAIISFGCGDSEKTHEVKAVKNASYSEHAKEFKKGVVKVTDGVWVAIGYGISNSIMIEGDDGLIIVDTMTTNEEAKEVLTEFRKITKKPVIAAIYTHSHPDHIFGTNGFAEGRKIDVYSHDTTQYYIDRVVNVIRPIISSRSTRMYGNPLGKGAVEHVGIGPCVGIHKDTKLESVRPNKTFSKKLITTIAGIRLELYHAPGETNDQIFVWIPEKKTLLPGDNFYKAFPNLYTIRGTSYRDVLAWAKSIDFMMEKNPEFLVPSHTRPLTGSKYIKSVLTDYRDAIQFVHDQTIRGMNQGLTPGQLVENVKLPQHLKNSPFLQEYYGTVEWSVRSVFSGYLGWFDGNPTTLRPLSPNNRSQKYIKLSGGSEKVVEEAKNAFNNKEYQWTLELTDHILRVEPKNNEARDLRVKALIKRGEAETNPNARHYYLTSAMELRDNFTATFEATPTLKGLHSIPLENIFTSMAVNLDSEKTIGLTQKVNFKFPDTKEFFSVSLRRGVADIKPRLVKNADITVTMDSFIWKEIVGKMRSPMAAFATGKIDIDGSKTDLVKFLGYFKPKEN
ncbi:MAG: MBL fold metallo-hydrolase [Desulfobacterales bacterium]|nr:MBL fold metallo-hydrolase [Desulfobacterales bacterium]MCP4163900.1 MBL fold metallo-hydrolase [Deltaproteobacteria bacterium]